MVGVNEERIKRSEHSRQQEYGPNQQAERINPRTRQAADLGNPTRPRAPANGGAWLLGDCSKRVVRGGSWSDAPKYLRSAVRYRYANGSRSFDYGFRVARTLSP